MGYMSSRYRAVEPARIEQRKVFRHPVQLQRAEICQDGQSAHQAELVDVSIYGCRIATDVNVVPGDTMWLNFTNESPVAASVIWSENGHIGCRFDDPINQALFRSLTLISE